MESTFIKKLDSVEFSFYSPAEAKELGLLEINALNPYDDKRVPIEGGVADPRLGVSPLSLDSCQVCNQDSNNCQGHLGYISLTSPVLNPFTIDIAYKLLKSKCAFCHRLKIQKDRARLLIIRKKLIKRGKLIDAVSIEDLISSKIIGDTGISEFDEIRDMILEEKSIIEKLAYQSSNTGKSESFSILNKVSNEITNQIWKSFASGCPHCKLKQPKLKKENDNKITRLPLKQS
jgi:DNA-directed RNA polymerase I subunit RPA1